MSKSKFWQVAGFSLLKRFQGKPLGFALSGEEWEELVEEQSLGDEDVEFQDAWNFLQAVQARNGFTLDEQQELSEAFDRFSDKSGEASPKLPFFRQSPKPRKAFLQSFQETWRGELENLKVKDLLTYLGFETGAPETAATSIPTVSRDHGPKRIEP